jgi:hypothetical protein
VGAEGAARARILLLDPEPIAHGDCGLIERPAIDVAPAMHSHCTNASAWNIRGRHPSYPGDLSFGVRSSFLELALGRFGTSIPLCRSPRMKQNQIPPELFFSSALVAAFLIFAAYSVA